MLHLWEDYRQLRPTKLVGLSAQQITWAEINEYDAANFCGLSAWEKRLIRRIDDAFEAARPENAGAGGKPKPTSVSDMRGSLRAAVAARAAKAAASKGAAE